MRSQARPSPHLRAPAASSSCRRRPRASHARTPSKAHGAPPRAHAAGGANRSLCVQTAQWAVAVGGDAGGARPMGRGLSALIGRRTHTHSATRALAGPTRAARFCAGLIVCRAVPPAGLVRRRCCPRAPGLSPSTARGIPTREGGAPGRRSGPRTPPAPHGAAAAAGNRRPWASGGWTCGARARGRPRSPPRGPRAPGAPTPGSASGGSGQGRAAQAWFFLSRPSWAGLQPRPAHAPGPVGKGQRRAGASRPDSSPQPAHWPARRADVSRRDFPAQDLPARRGATAGPPPTGPGQCPCFRARQAVSRDRQFPASACQTLGIGGRPILFRS